VEAFLRVVPGLDPPASQQDQPTVGTPQAAPQSEHTLVSS
jgi:hypothetical protein